MSGVGWEASGVGWGGGSIREWGSGEWGSCAFAALFFFHCKWPSSMRTQQPSSDAHCALREASAPAARFIFQERAKFRTRRRRSPASAPPASGQYGVSDADLTRSAGIKTAPSNGRRAAPGARGAGVPRRAVRPGASRGVRGGKEPQQSSPAISKRVPLGPDPGLHAPRARDQPAAWRRRGIHQARQQRALHGLASRAAHQAGRNRACGAAAARAAVRPEAKGGGGGPARRLPCQGAPGARHWQHGAARGSTECSMGQHRAHATPAPPTASLLRPCCTSSPSTCNRRATSSTRSSTPPFSSRPTRSSRPARRCRSGRSSTRGRGPASAAQPQPRRPRGR
jgi:hypothetical protein